jgi:hypothetical protein
LLVAITTTPVSAAPLAILECQEHLDRDWPAELIHYDCTFEPGKCLSTDVFVRDDSGRELAAQMSRVSKHADGSIQRADVWWVLSLQPSERRQFLLLPANAPCGRSTQILPRDRHA